MDYLLISLINTFLLNNDFSKKLINEISSNIVLLVTLVLIVSIFYYLDDLYDFKKLIRSKNYGKSSIVLGPFKEKNLSTNFRAVISYLKDNNIKINHYEESTWKRWCSKLDGQKEFSAFIPKDNIIYTIDNCINLIIKTEIRQVDNASHIDEKYTTYYTLTIFTNKTSNIKVINDFLKKCNCEYLDKINKTILYRPNYFVCNKSDKIYIDRIEFNSNKNMNNLHFEQKKEVLSYINNFFNNKKLYDKIGKPWCLGFLLHGEPGCGKSSFIKALINYLNKINDDVIHSINLNLNDLNDIENIFLNSHIGDYNIPLKNRIYIIEDIDCGCLKEIIKKRDMKDIDDKIKLSIDDEKIDDNLKDVIDFIKKKDSKDNLSRLLNILDGNIETPGRILIATTNHIDYIDPAVIRPGRFDKIIHFKKCSKEIFKDIFNNCFDTNYEIEKFCKYNDYTLSPAEVTQLCFDNIDNKDNIFNLLI